jgi:DNA-3-methyladenine glycosylase
MDNYLSSLGLDLSDSIKAARSLLGYKLIRKESDGSITSGYIVETEAYRNDDPASHSFKGLTKRTTALFEGSGTVYVYFTYGMHYCVNIVTGPENYGQAVLIRAIEPIEGIDLMKYRRNQTDDYKLTNGPAKLTQALGIEMSLNGSNLKDGPISIVKGYKPKEIVVSKRIGISQAKDEPWRFYIAGNKFVSRL